MLVAQKIKKESKRAQIKNAFELNLFLNTESFSLTQLFRQHSCISKSTSKFSFQFLISLIQWAWKEALFNRVKGQ